ncbi:MAG: putative zinc-binding metallopeptidase, partial [Alistipes sp.]|nr:putative zinc-binding metallopeptidase [Alistipes sp.]
EATWEAWLEAAGEDGRAKLEKKRLILKNWLMESFGVDSDKWREVYLRRVAELDNIDWTNLDD